MDEEHTATFELDKVTKNTYRFAELQDGQPPIIGNQYVKQWVFGDDPPDRITVTVAAIDD